ncbi:MAG: PF20097 family protein [Tissierellia bacterium]|nr:PF20097 family protein [Tissierellia bacterium]
MKCPKCHRPMEEGVITGKKGFYYLPKEEYQLLGMKRYQRDSKEFIPIGFLENWGEQTVPHIYRCTHCHIITGMIEEKDRLKYVRDEF